MSTDGISRVLARIGVQATTFYSGPLCGMHDFDETEGLGHLHVIRAGHVRAVQAGQPPLDIHEPSLLFYPRPINHRLDVPEAVAADVLCASVRYDAGRDNPVTQSLPAVVAIPFSALPRLDATLSLLFAEADEFSHGRQAMLDRLCDVLLIQIIRYALTSGQVERGLLVGFAHERLAPLLAALLDNPAKAWTLNTMAKQMHLSRSAFSLEFRRVIGTPPADFLTRVRITRAQTLLRAGRPVAWVADSVGYRSQPAFSRAFIREVGIGPSRWQTSAGQDANAP